MDVPVPAKTKLNRLALASFALGVAGLVTIPIPLIPSCAIGLIGVLFGCFALLQILRRGGRGWDWAFTVLGLITGLLPAAGWCALIYTLTYALLKGMQAH